MFNDKSRILEYGQQILVTKIRCQKQLETIKMHRKNN